MRRILCILLIMMIGTQTVHAEMTDLQHHLQSMQDRLSKGEDLYDEHTKPGAFNVTFEGIDEESNSPLFHVTFTSNEYYNSYSDWIYRFDVTAYVDGTFTYFQTRNDKSETVSTSADENNRYSTVNYDYEVYFNNPDDLPLEHTYTFALTRIGQNSMNIMFAMNDISYDVVYDPEAVEGDDGTNQQQTNDGQDYDIENLDDENTKGQNNRNASIYGMILGLGGTAAFVMLSRRRKVRLKKKPAKGTKVKTHNIPEKTKKQESPPHRKPEEKKNIFTKFADTVKKVGTTAVKGLKKVSKTMTGVYDKITTLGIDTKYGRIEISDITNLSGAGKIMDAVRTVEDLCDVINKNKDIKEVWKNAVNRVVDKNIKKLKDLVGKGLKLDTATVNKLININKEINTIKGLVKDGVSMDELFDLDEKMAKYKDETTEVEKFRDHTEKTVKKFNKGADIEGNNIKKVFRGKR